MPGRAPIKPAFFARQSDFRKWLQRNHEKESELWVGFYKKDTGKPSITWPESVDEALCFGWIDGIRKSLDADSYVIRFTPRKPRSIWSTKNSNRMNELIELGLVKPAGLAAFEKREVDSSRYSFEQGDVALGAEHERKFRQNRRAWAFFQAQPPYYRKVATWYVISAKREETRLKRLATLIGYCEAGERLPPLQSPEKGKKQGAS
ncbi:MAG: YdeI/OmpD-associated family protein [Longimicrobiales bacterium]